MHLLACGVLGLFIAKCAAETKVSKLASTLDKLKTAQTTPQQLSRQQQKTRKQAYTCAPESFKSSVNLTFCPNLTGYRDIQTLEACRDFCCGNITCGVWEWCPESPGGCAHWASARCHTGPAPDPTQGACPYAAHWIGQTRVHLPHPPSPGPSPGPGPGPNPSPPPSPPSPQPAARRKQGFSGFLGKDFSCDDASFLGLSDSWWYTWTPNTNQYSKCNHVQPSKLGHEFVPMVIGLGLASKDNNSHFLKEWAASNAHYLLGYNEPDYGNGHNHPHMCHPADAARDWPNVTALAKLAGLSLVSPAVSTTGLDDTGRSQWLDEFYGNCSTVVPDCNVSSIEYVAFHDYNGDAKRLVGRAEGMAKRYGKPVWITEFGINKWARIVNGKCENCNITRAMEDQYMQEVLPLLDASPAVHRYAWFTARDKPTPGIAMGNLLVSDNPVPTLTSTGAIYKAHAQKP